MKTVKIDEIQTTVLIKRLNNLFAERRIGKKRLRNIFLWYENYCIYWIEFCCYKDELILC